MKKEKYSLFTAICMITGIVIGSGIFFKADDILRYTNGNMFLGILVFIIASIAIVFGSLTISQLAMRTDRPGGIIGYAEEFLNKHIACAFGWFQLFVYLPALIATVSEVASIYLCQLFSLDLSLELHTIMSLCITCILFAVNLFSAKAGGYIQNGFMIIKMIPLVLIAILGLSLGNPSRIALHDLGQFSSASGSLTWISAFAPVAFSFDGWIVATTLSHEIKNSKRNLPIALSISPIIILAAYVAYFAGITSLLGQKSVLVHGDSSVYLAASQLFGPSGAKLMLVFIIISVLGTDNGLVLSMMRLPYTLAGNQMLPFGRMVRKKGKETAFSCIYAFAVSVLWIFISFAAQKLPFSGDISEISICVNYLNYIVLYVIVLRLSRHGEIKGLWKGCLNPVLAIAGSLLICSGTISNPLFAVAIVPFYGIMLTAYCYSKKQDR